jgi:hypothetical protein
MSSKTMSSTSGFGTYGSFNSLQASIQKPKWLHQKNVNQIVIQSLQLPLIKA